MEDAGVQVQVQGKVIEAAVEEPLGVMASPSPTETPQWEPRTPPGAQLKAAQGARLRAELLLARRRADRGAGQPRQAAPSRDRLSLSRTPPRSPPLTPLAVAPLSQHERQRGVALFGAIYGKEKPTAADAYLAALELGTEVSIEDWLHYLMTKRAAMSRTTFAEFLTYLEQMATTPEALALTLTLTLTLLTYL